MYYLGCTTTNTTVTNKGMRCSYTIYVDAKCINNLYPRRFDALNCKIRKGLTKRIKNADQIHFKYRIVCFNNDVSR